MNSIISDNPPPDVDLPPKEKKLFFIPLLGIYLLINVYYALASSPMMENIRKQIIPQNNEIKFESIMSLLDDEVWVGQWQREVNDFDSKSFSKNRCQVIFNKIFQEEIEKFELNFLLMNGQFIDYGSSALSTVVDRKKWNVNKNQKSLFIESTGSHMISNVTSNILQKFEEKQQEVRFNLNVYEKEDQPQLIVKLIDEKNQNSFQMNLQVEGWREKLNQMILGLCFVMLSSVELFGALTIVREMLEHNEKIKKFSFWFLLTNFIWDFVLFCICVKLCVERQNNFIYFVIPAMLFWVLCFFVVLRMLKLTYKKKREPESSEKNKFWFLLISSSLTSYPIFVVTNFNNIFLISLPFLVLLQFYRYAAQNYPPTFTDPFNLYIFPRYLFIFYLRCYSGNVFNLQPHYLFSCCYFFLILYLFLLMGLQKKFGPRIIFPEFVLPPTLKKYSLEELPFLERLRVGDCAICLDSLQYPPSQSTEASSKILEGPCNHKYHEECIKPWMQVRSECPQCRGQLPPPP